MEFKKAEVLDWIKNEPRPKPISPRHNLKQDIIDFLLDLWDDHITADEIFENLEDEEKEFEKAEVLDWIKNTPRPPKPLTKSKKKKINKYLIENPSANYDEIVH